MDLNFGESVFGKQGIPGVGMQRMARDQSRWPMLEPMLRTCFFSASSARTYVPVRSSQNASSM